MLHTTISSDPTTASVLAGLDAPMVGDLTVLQARSEEDQRLSGIDQAIAAAEAVLPELRRMDAEMEVLRKALPTPAQRIAARDQARLATARPDALVFLHSLSKALVRMELHYADGSTRITDDFDPAHRPATREQLEIHCRQAGLEEEPLLAIWDDWQTRLSEAEAGALSPAHREAENAHEALQMAWDAAHETRRDLAAAILSGPEDAATPTLRQIASYLQVMDYGSLEDAFDCDDRLLVQAICMHLAPGLRTEALRPAWDEARRRYGRACETESAADDAEYEATDRALRSVADPLPEAWRHLNGQPVSVFTLNQIAEHRFVFDALPEERGKAVEVAVRRYWEDVRKAEAGRDGTYASVHPGAGYGRCRLEGRPDAQSSAWRLC